MITSASRFSPRCMRRTGQTMLAAALAAVLAGCSLTPKYERPAAPVASQWAGSAKEALAKNGGAAAHATPWQDFVQDERLREIIGLALENNRDLRVAIKNIELAQAQYRISRADIGPSLGASFTGSRSRPNTSTLPNAPTVASSYTVGLGVSDWEIDLFGRLRALSSSALAKYLATEEARKNTQISLVGSVASAWLNLQADNELLALAERTLVTREQSQALTKLRLDAGVSSALDMRQAEALTESAKATVAQQRRLREQDINALTLLVGQPVPEQLLPTVPSVEVASTGQPGAQVAVPTVSANNTLSRFADVAVGLPSDVLLDRPDIRAAEQQLIAANANIGAARAAFFPRVSLTGSYGRLSNEVDNLFSSGTSVRAWSFGPQITLPIFDWGRLHANLQASKASRDIALAQYEQAIQTAFSEVANALAGRATLGDQLTALEAQATASRETYRLSELRYRNGVANYLQLLDAQRSLFASEQALVQTRLLERLNQVALYKALGGGWTVPANATAQQPAATPAATAARPAAVPASATTSAPATAS